MESYLGRLAVVAAEISSHKQQPTVKPQKHRQFMFLTDFLGD